MIYQGFFTTFLKGWNQIGPPSLKGIRVDPNEEPPILQKNGVTLPETNSSPLKIDHWKRRFLLETIIFRGDLLVLGSVTVE